MQAEKIILNADGLNAAHNATGEPINPEHVRMCRAFIKMYFEPARSMNRLDSSYLLKHVVEHFAQALHAYGYEISDEFGKIENRGYIQNGAFILAMTGEGYNYTKRTLNPKFNFRYKGPKIPSGPGTRRNYEMPRSKEDWKRAFSVLGCIEAEAPKANDHKEATANENNARKGV